MFFKYHFHRKNTSLQYIHHPINAFHMLKRIAQWMPKIVSLIPTIKFEYDLLSMEEEYQRASLGLADLHHYYNISIEELSEGKIKNSKNDRVYLSKSGLNTFELMQIAQEAKSQNYLDDYVSWLIVALKKAKQENKNTKYIRNIK